MMYKSIVRNVNEDQEPEINIEEKAPWTEKSYFEFRSVNIERNKLEVTFYDDTEVSLDITQIEKILRVHYGYDWKDKRQLPGGLSQLDEIVDYETSNLGIPSLVFFGSNAEGKRGVMGIYMFEIRKITDPNYKDFLNTKEELEKQRIGRDLKARKDQLNHDLNTIINTRRLADTAGITSNDLIEVFYGKDDGCFKEYSLLVDEAMDKIEKDIWHPWRP